jgi:hypothetical protein
MSGSAHRGFNLGLFQKKFNSTSRVSTAAVNMGCTKGRGSTTRMFNYCNKHSPNPSECINQFINIQKISLYLYSKNNTTSGGFPVGEPVDKDMKDNEYTYQFDPQEYYPEYFPGMAPFVDGNIVDGDKGTGNRLLASYWNNLLG